MSDPTDNLTPRRHTLRWVVFALCLAGGLLAAGWWLAGRRMYTDDRTILARASDSAVREVLWTKPQPPGDLFNTDAEEYEPSVSPDGNELFFVRGKAGRNAEIFVSRRQDGRWLAATPLTSVNSASDDLGPRLTPDGRHLLFYSDRPGGVGGYDLWAAPRLPDGSFGPAFNLGPSVNTEFNEYSPAPTPDGRRLYFASNRRAAAAEQKQAWRATIRQSAVGDYDLFVADRDEFAATTQVVDAENNRSAEADPTSQPATAPADVGSAVGSASADRLLPPPTSQPTTAPAPPTSLAFRPAAEVPNVNTPYHEGA